MRMRVGAGPGRVALLLGALLALSPAPAAAQDAGPPPTVDCRITDPEDGSIVPPIDAQFEDLCEDTVGCAFTPASGHPKVESSCDVAPCTSQMELSGWLPELNYACCGGPGEDCSSGVPSSCDEECAAVLWPFMSAVRPRSDCLLQLEC